MKLIELIAGRLKSEFNRIQSQFASGCSVPIGGIIMIQNSIPGIPILPSNFIGCNGQVLNDVLSPLHGQTMPNLNNQEVYIRGGLVAGVSSSSQFRTGSPGFTFQKMTMYYAMRIK